MDSDEHRLLTALRDSELKDAEARNRFYQTVIDSLEMEDCNYLILLACDVYDVPHRSKDDELQPDASDEVFRYILCSICPVKDGNRSLAFSPGTMSSTAAWPARSSHSRSWASSSPLSMTGPQTSIMRSSIPGRRTRYITSSSPPFSIRNRPSPPPEQREGFQAALSGALDDSFNMEVVQAVHEQLLDKIEQHKESKDPEPLTVSVQEVAAILKDCGVADTQVAAFEAQCGEQFGDGAVLNPENIIDSKHFEVKTADASVAIDPKRSYIVETRIIDGRKYLLIPADEGVEVNGMAVGIAAADRRA